MKQAINHTYRRISNDITAAEDTGNGGELQELGNTIHSAMMTGKLSITEAASLQADLDIAIDSVGSMDGNTDHIRHCVTERAVDDL